MKTKIIDPIREKVIIRDHGIITETYITERCFETIREDSGNKGRTKVEDSGNTHEIEVDHSNDMAIIKVDGTRITITTPHLQCFNWWGSMNEYFKREMVRTYIQDIAAAGYTIKGGETL